MERLKNLLHNLKPASPYAKYIFYAGLILMVCGYLMALVLLHFWQLSPNPVQILETIDALLQMAPA